MRPTQTRPTPRRARVSGRVRPDAYTRQRERPGPPAREQSFESSPAGIVLGIWFRPSAGQSPRSDFTRMEDVALEAPRHGFPLGKWLAVVWLAVWVPVYANFWGWRNFLALCD